MRSGSESTEESNSNSAAHGETKYLKMIGKKCMGTYVEISSGLKKNCAEKGAVDTWLSDKVLVPVTVNK